MRTAILYRISSWEWNCPVCKRRNVIFERPNKAMCKNCENVVEMEIPGESQTNKIARKKQLSFNFKKEE